MFIDLEPIISSLDHHSRASPQSACALLAEMVRFIHKANQARRQ